MVIVCGVLTGLNKGAFSNCSSLTSINVDANNTKYKSVVGSLYTKDGKTLVQYAIGKEETSFEISSDVTSIGNGAFYGCSNLTNITLPDSVTIIGNRAFYGCSSLTSITIPDSVTSIGVYAFLGCRSLTSVTIPDSVTSIGDYAFFACSKLTSITIGNSVASIGKQAFENCSSLTGVCITDISAWCKISFSSDLSNPLYYAHNLYLNGVLITKLEIPNSVTSIGDYAFLGCSSLTSITIPNSVTSIGDRAFSNCSSLTSITVDENNSYYKSIDGNLYTKDGTMLIQYAIGKLIHLL